MKKDRKNGKERTKNKKKRKKEQRKKERRNDKKGRNARKMKKERTWLFHGVCRFWCHRASELCSQNLAVVPCMPLSASQGEYTAK